MWADHCSSKLILQKRLRKDEAVRGNLLDCRKNFVWIEVRSKWQSGSIFGDDMNGALIGNGCFGNKTVVLWEIQPDLSRKINT